MNIVKKMLFAILFGVLLVLGACGGGTNNNNDGNVNDPNDNAQNNLQDNLDENGQNNMDGNAGNNNEGNTGDNTNDNAGTTDVALAEQAYKNKCSGCHGGDLGGGMGPALTNTGANYSVEEIEDIIQNGKGSMPAVPMEDDERRTVAEWLADKK